MALQVRSGGQWKPINASWVRSGGSWRQVRHVFTATHTERVYPDGDMTKPLVDFTHYTLVRAFAAPTEQIWSPPGLTVLSTDPSWEPGGGPRPPENIRATFEAAPRGQWVIGHSGYPDTYNYDLRGFWSREIRVELARPSGDHPTGTVVTQAIITNPDQQVWQQMYMGTIGGFIRARMRYVNEAGAGRWTDLSGEAYVYPHEQD